MAAPWNATAGGVTAYVAAPQPYGQALSLVGTGWLTLPAGPADFATGASWTVEARVKTSSTARAFAVGNNSTGSWWIGTANAANGFAEANVTGIGTITGTASIADGGWHHLALVVQRGVTAYFYVDGALVGIKTGTFTGAAGTTAIGRWGASNAILWNGSIDEVAISTNTAQYGAPFVPPVGPLSETRAGQSALYHLDGTANDASTTVVPPTIGIITGLQTGGNDVIYWPAPVAGSNPIASVNLYRSTSIGTETLLANIPGAGPNTFTYPSAAAGTLSYYTAKAVDSVGTLSAVSNEVVIGGGVNSATGTSGSPTYVAGKFGQALHLVGSQWVILPNPGAFTFVVTNSWTTELWCRSSSAVGTQVALGAGGTNAQWLGLVAGVPTCSTPGFAQIAGSVSVADGAWHHLAVVCTSGTSLKFFVDGTQVGVTTAGTYAGNARGVVAIGSFVSGSTFIGDIDDVSISQATAQYTTTFTPPTVTFTGTRAGQSALYHLDGNGLDANGVLLGPTAPVLSGASQAGGNDTIPYSASTAGDNAITGYVLEKASQPGGASSAIAATNAAPGSGSFVVASSLDSSHVYYTVRSYDAGGTPTYSPASNEIALPVPQILAPNNAAILFSPFNWNVQAGSATSVNAGAYFRLMFTGQTCVLRFDASKQTAPIYIAYRIDGQSWVYALIDKNSSVVNCTSPALVSTNHSLEVAYVGNTSVLLDRWVTPVNAIVLTAIEVDAGATIAAPPARTYNVLIYGDSITEGTQTGLTVNFTFPMCGAVHDALRDYSFNLANLLDAEVGVVGFGSQGWNLPVGTGVPAFTSSYNLLYAGVSRTFTSPAPDLVIYNMGTNDGASTALQIQTAATTVVNGIIAAAPASKHLLLNPLSAPSNTTTGLPAAVTAIGSSKVTYQSQAGFTVAGDIPGVHPLGEAHVYRIATKVAALAVPLLNAAAPSVTGTRRRVG